MASTPRLCFPDMDQLNFLGGDPQRFTVSELTHYLRGLLESDYRLGDLTVSGEVSNVSQPSSGHMYFSLKDAGATLRCVMWRSDVARQAFLPSDGQAVEVHGHIGVYEAAGQYQLYADEIRVGGEGDLYSAFLRLKSRLEAEGLFDPERKRPLPVWPGTIGVVTSPAAAALRDVIDVLRRRFPLAQVVLSPTPVQGAEAPESIIDALHAITTFAEPDVILLVRGGGSMEDLAAFNDEGLARAIAASAVPVVSGVGHETDFTIADFVADRRAPTPSAAAEIVSPDRDELQARLRVMAASMGAEMRGRLAYLRQGLGRRLARIEMASPSSQLANARQRVDDAERRLVDQLGHLIALKQADVRRLTATLGAVGPPAVLERGYALVSREADGALVRSTSQVSGRDAIRIRVHDGSFGAEVVGEPDADSQSE
jgi:exodeoxyribonuclease VII large subunit